MRLTRSWRLTGMVYRVTRTTPASTTPWHTSTWRENFQHTPRCTRYVRWTFCASTPLCLTCPWASFWRPTSTRPDSGTGWGWTGPWPSIEASTSGSGNSTWHSQGIISSTRSIKWSFSLLLPRHYRVGGLPPLPLPSTPSPLSMGTLGGQTRTLSTRRSTCEQEMPGITDLKFCS